MQIGSGLQNKLLEAMAMKLPCITTSLANNALGANRDTEILVGNNANEIAAHIVNLLNDKILFDKISLGGNEFVKKKYSWEKVILKLEEVIK